MARPATLADRHQLSELMYSAPHLHRHLDWRPPLDWIGQGPFWVLEGEGRVWGALACPRDPQPIAWIRLFCFASTLSVQETWHCLWERARSELSASGGAMAAAIATQRWIEPLLVNDGFGHLDDIVVLSCDVQHADPVLPPPGVTIAAITPDDLPAVAEADAAAFHPLWRNSLDALSRAFLQASYASLAREGSRVLGYQLSTASPLGTHLARLAIKPEAQRRGIAAALVSDLISRVGESGPSHLTVNTQARNVASLALYGKLSFELTGERYAVYATNIASDGLEAADRSTGVAGAI